MAKGGVVPVARPQDDRNYAGATCLVPLNRSLHLYIVAIVGCQEIGADQKKDDFRRLNVLIYRVVNILASLYPSVVPYFNNTLSF